MGIATLQARQILYVLIIRGVMAGSGLSNTTSSREKVPYQHKQQGVGSLPAIAAKSRLYHHSQRQEYVDSLPSLAAAGRRFATSNNSKEELLPALPSRSSFPQQH
jgi:hypothetical protein